LHYFHMNNSSEFEKQFHKAFVNQYRKESEHSIVNNIVNEKQVFINQFINEVSSCFSDINSDESYDRLKYYLSQTHILATNTQYKSYIMIILKIQAAIIHKMIIFISEKIY